MLNHYSILIEIARQRQQVMLQQAQAERLYRQFRGNREGLLKQAGQRLLAAASQLKASRQSKPVTPLLDRK